MMFLTTVSENFALQLARLFGLQFSAYLYRFEVFLVVLSVNRSLFCLALDFIPCYFSRFFETFL